jgi:hypothetical protein
MILLFLALGIYSNFVQAQPLKQIQYLGFEGTYGVRSFTIKSSIPQLSQMPVLEFGGSLGVIVGNDFVRAKVRAAGFYYSASNVPRTVDLFETEALFNFYPLQYFSNHKNSLDVYITGGASLDFVKFYGYYLGIDKKVNYSVPDEPYLGRLTQINATIGLGIEYQLPLQYDFVHLFAEAKYSTPLQSKADKRAFDQTSILNFTSLSVGVGFGLLR